MYHGFRFCSCRVALSLATEAGAKLCSVRGLSQGFVERSLANLFSYL